MKIASIAIAVMMLSMIPIVYAEEDKMEFLTNVEMIKAHLHASLLSKQANDLESAMIHASHSIELYTLIVEEINDEDPLLADDLDSRFTDLQNKAQTLSIEEYEDELNLIISLLEQAIEKAIGDVSVNDKMQIMINLLESAEERYEEAISDAGEILEMIKYQDAQALVDVAEGVFDSIKDDIDENEREELELFFAQLKDKVSNVVSIEDLENTIRGMVNELKDMLGIDVKSEELPTIEEIRLMLNSILDEYKEGEYDEAERLAARLYLEKYELLEPEIAKVDEELMEETEVMIREQLRQLIKDRASIEEIEALINDIKSNLDEIEALGIGVGEDPRMKYVRNIEALLDEIVIRYEQGNYEEAQNLAMQAYLDNYELIEDDVKGYDEELNEEFEQLLRIELANKIKDRASIEEVQATVDMIKAKLEIIETQVIPEFPIPLGIGLISAIALAAVIMMSKRSIQ